MPRRRVRLRWAILIALVIGVLGVYAATWRYGATVYFTSEVAAGVEGGAILIQLPDSTPPRSMSPFGLQITSAWPKPAPVSSSPFYFYRHDFGFRWWVRSPAPILGSRLIEIPLWMPLAPVAAIGLAVGLRRALRHGAGQCARCGYDLTGCASAVCPECGSMTTPPATASAAPPDPS